MKRTGGDPSGAESVYRALRFVALALAAVLAAGTVWGLLKNVRVSPPAEKPAEVAGDAWFTGLGNIRTATADKKPATVVVSVVFPFDKNDGPFAEELASRTGEFRRIAAAFFSSKTAAELKAAPEERLKEELLERFNSRLVLGKIAVLYFNDYLLVD